MLRAAVKQILFNQPVKPIVSINGTQGLALDAAGGALTNGRTSTATVIDFEGLVKTCKANEIRYAGARRVENLITASDDITNAAWNTSTATRSAGNIATGVGANSYVFQGVIITPVLHVIRVKLTRVTGSGNIQISADSGQSYTTVPVTTTPTVFSVQSTGTTGRGLVVRIATAGDQVKVEDCQIEVVQGHAVQAPSEYVLSTTVNNSGIVKVKYFDYQNGNTVVSNVVTEATGAAISPAPVILHEGAATNLAYPSKNGGNPINAGTGIAPVVTANYAAARDGTITATRIQFNKGAGETAGDYSVCNQGITTSTGVATVLSIYAKSLSGTPTVAAYVSAAVGSPVGAVATLSTTAWTLISVSYTTTNTNPFPGIGLVGSAFIGQATSQTADIIVCDRQYEVGSYRTSIIPTVTVAVTRATDSLSLPVVQDTNFYQAQGITLVKCKMKFANSASNKALLAINTGATDLLYDNGSGGIALADGTNTATAAVGGWTVDDTLLIAACRNKRDGKMSIHVSKNSGAWTDSADATYDGSVSAGANILLSSANTDSIEFNHVKLYKSNKSFAAMQKWIKAKAVQESA